MKKIPLRNKLKPVAIKKGGNWVISLYFSDDEGQEAVMKASDSCFDEAMRQLEKIYNKHMATNGYWRVWY